MVDIHTHILPGVDDGSGSYEESFEMVKNSCKNGTEKIVLTPHFYYEQKGNSNCIEIKRRFDEFSEKIKQAQIGAELFLGSEVFCSGEFLSEISARNFFTLNESRYLLVEFDFYELPEKIFKGLECVSNAGYIPILAHPERYRNLRSDFRAAETLADSGYLIQLNSTDILHPHSDIAFEFSEWLLKNRLVSFIASDCHDLVYRKSGLEDIFGWVFSNISKNYAERIFYENPEKVLNNEAL